MPTRGGVAYLRRAKDVDALIADAYLSGTSIRRVSRALASLFGGVVSKSTVSRIWRKIKGDGKAWTYRDLGNEDVIRLILDGTVVKVRLDGNPTSITLPLCSGYARTSRRSCPLSRAWAARAKRLGGPSRMIDDRRPQEAGSAIVDGAPGLEKALVSLWSDLAIRRGTVHKLRNLIAYAPMRLGEEVAGDHADMIYAEAVSEFEKPNAFPSKGRKKCEAVATSLAGTGDKLFTFTRLPVAQWKAARTTNVIERLHLEFKRRIKTRCILPSAETAAMLFRALLASGQIVLRKVDGWATLGEPLAEGLTLSLE